MGLGNILCGDDAFGIHVVDNLYSSYDFTPPVQIIDGGTQGSTLYGFVEDSAKLLVIDTVDFDLQPGTLTVTQRAGIPVWLGMCKMSPHQDSFSELLALASLKNSLPDEICLIGLQPSHTDFGSIMTRMAQEKIPEALSTALEILKSWGIESSRNMVERHLLSRAFLP